MTGQNIVITNTPNFSVNNNTVTNVPTFSNILNIESNINDLQNNGLETKIGVSSVSVLSNTRYLDLYDGYTVLVGNNGSSTTHNGGGTFKWAAASTATPDNAMVVAIKFNLGPGRFIRAVSLTANSSARFVLESSSQWRQM
jgi:hypothetical protein